MGKGGEDILFLHHAKVNKRKYGVLPSINDFRTIEEWAAAVNEWAEAVEKAQTQEQRRSLRGGLKGFRAMAMMMPTIKSLLRDLQGVEEERCSITG